MKKTFASKDRNRAILVDMEEETIVKSYGFSNILCCYPFTEDGVIAMEELEETEDSFEWDN